MELHEAQDQDRVSASGQAAKASSCPACGGGDPILDQALHVGTGLTSLETSTPWNSVSAAASLCPTVCSVYSEQELALRRAQAPPPRPVGQQRHPDWRRRRYDVPGSTPIQSSFDCRAVTHAVSAGRRISTRTSSRTSSKTDLSTEGDSSGSTMGPMPQSSYLSTRGKDPCSAYAAGPLQRRRMGLFWRWRWCVLEHCELLIYSDEAHAQNCPEAPVERFDARDFTVHWDPLEPQEFRCCYENGAACVLRTGSAGCWEENASARLWIQALRLASTSGSSAWSAAPLIF